MPHPRTNAGVSDEYGLQFIFTLNGILFLWHLPKADRYRVCIVYFSRHPLRAAPSLLFHAVTFVGMVATHVSSALPPPHPQCEVFIVQCEAALWGPV